MLLTKAMKKVVGIVLASILAVGILTMAACSTNSPALRIDDPAPDFKLKDLSGQTISPSSFQGKVVLMNFWSTTCVPCVDEMPSLQAIHSDLSAKNNFTVLMVNVGEDTTTVKNFIQKNNYTFPVVLDSQYEVAGKYKVQYTPTSILIGKDGIVKFSIIGAFKNKAAIEKQLASYLN